MFNNRKRIMSKGILIFCLCFFTVNLTTWATQVNDNIVKIKIEPNIKGQTRFCTQCFDEIFDKVVEIHSRTDTAGSRCRHCTTTTSMHLTDVYTLRKESSCSKTCTFELIEHLPTEYRCKRAN